MAMTMRKDMLDDSAEQLYRELGGIDSRYIQKTTADVSDKTLRDEEEKQDRWRLLMVEIAHLLSAYISDIRLSDGLKTQKDLLGELLQSLENISEMPDHDGSVLIRYRGFPTGTGASADIDYVIVFGNLSIDAAAGAAMLNRMGVKMSHLSGRLTKAFRVFSEQGISTLHIEIPKADSDAKQLLRDALEIISRYDQAFKRNSPIVFEKNGKQTILPLTPNEKNQTDINLTLLSGLNSIPPQNMRAMVGKIGHWLKENDSLPYVSVYDAMFNIRSLEGKLIKPLIEVNNIKWLSLDRQSMVVSKESAKVSRIISERFGSSPQSAQIIQTVYGKDYHQISSEHLGERLKLATDLLESVEESDKNQNIETEVLRNIGKNFEDVQDEVFDNIIIRNGVLNVRSGKKETMIGNVHSRLQKIVSFYKGRADAHKKMKNLIKRGIDFDVRDYQTIARDFDISADSAKNLIGLLKSCFDTDGHFLRSMFERYIPEFARYENKVFRFLWHYLKETPMRNERVAFLNSLQLLILKMKKPANAIEMLLSDVLKEPGKVNFSDRNAFMLATLLLRNYNRELNADIEMTPEEVLQVKNGLDHEVVKETLRILDAYRERLFEKVGTIYILLNQSVESENPAEEGFPPKFLLRLEREMYIFLSLLGGNTARAVLRSAVKLYGNPVSGIYLSKTGRNYAALLAQHLTVAVRGLHRAGEKQDLNLLEQVKSGKAGFLSFSKNSEYVAKVGRLMTYVDSAYSGINPTDCEPPASEKRNRCQKTQRRMG